ncbi:MAG: PQQ-binding-like beta-propeller repeat protein [Verrucomicrobiae bacterium]|nr:PQQ-binding-like beta-propeller repeat protein [Verrucomicrobiae bacterium]
MGFASADDWPQFRGVNGSGVATGTNPLPTEFSFESKVLWKAKLGDGIGSSVIVGGRVFNTALVDEKAFVVYCHDAASGKELWKREFPAGDLPRITPPNSHASSTPAADGERVYVYFSTLGLLAFDAETGEDAWRHELPRPAYLMDWGAGASPVVYDGRVFFAQDDDLNPFLIALDAKTGRELWKTPRPEMLAGYSLPVICEAGGRKDLVVAGSGKLIGYDPASGKEIWHSNSLLRTIMTSPVVDGDLIYVAVQSYGDSTRTLKFALLEWLDTNQDGKLAREEMPKEFLERFDVSDKNHDKLIDETEIDTAFQHPNNQAAGGNTIQAVRGGGTGNVTKTHVVWNIDNKSPSNLSSPLVFNQRLHVVKSGGISSCFDAKDGSTVWDRTRLKNFGDYYASPIAADGKVYIAGRNGFVVVLDDKPELSILAKNDMGEEILATPSVADGKLFIRTRESVYCISNEAK